MVTPKPINTRILLRNDTLANWNSSQLVLGKGEVAIATGLNGNLVEVRVGNGTTTWSGAAKLAVDASQISGIVQLIQGTAKKYQVVANRENGNSWKLQQAPLSATDNEWTDVAGSTTWTVDFSGLSYGGGEFGATKFVTKVTEANGVVAAEYAQPAISDINGLQTALGAKLDKTTFSTISNDIGLSAAGASNPVATKKDIASLDKVMHFKGVVNAVPSLTSGYEVGDVVLVAGATGEAAKDNGKEFVLVNIGSDTNPELKWELIGDQNAISALTGYVDTAIGNLSNAVTANYATKNELTASAHGLSTDYNRKIENITSTYATKEYADSTSAYALGEAKTYTETLSGEVKAISAIITSDYAEKTYVNGISAELSTETRNEITAVVGQANDLSSANTVYGAKKYAEQYADATSAYALEQATGYADTLSTALSNTVSTDYIRHHEVVDTDLSGFFILSCGAASLREGEPTDHIA